VNTSSIACGLTGEQMSSAFNFHCSLDQPRGKESEERLLVVLDSPTIRRSILPFFCCCSIKKERLIAVWFASQVSLICGGRKERQLCPPLTPDLLHLREIAPTRETSENKYFISPLYAVTKPIFPQYYIPFRLQCS